MCTQLYHKAVGCEELIVQCTFFMVSFWVAVAWSFRLVSRRGQSILDAPLESIFQLIFSERNPVHGFCNTKKNSGNVHY